MILTEQKARSAEGAHRVVIGRSTPGLMFTPDQPRMSLEYVVKRWGRWVWLCSSINARVAASIQPRLFAIGNSSLVAKSPRMRAKPVDPLTKAYLRGQCRLQPGSVASKKLAGNIEDLTEITNHEFLDLLNDVNEWEEGFSYRQSLYADLQWAGRFFTLLVGQKNKAPDQLWRMLPHYTTPIPDARKFISGFRYKHGAEELTYSPDEVFWAKNFDPVDPWGGVGWVQAWLTGIDADFAMVDFQDWLFKRGGSPDFVVKTEKEFSPEQKRQFRFDWRRLFGRMFRREESVAFLSGEKSDIIKLSQNPREMEYAKGREQSRDEICAASGVPKSYITTDDVNLANAREGSPTHIRITIWPMISMFEDAANQRLLPKWSDRLVLIHDNPLVAEDKAVVIQDRESKLRSGWTFNEIRLAEGEETIDDEYGDTRFIAQGLTPLENAANPVDPMEQLQMQIDSAERMASMRQPPEKQESGEKSITIYNEPVRETKEKEPESSVRTFAVPTYIVESLSALRKAEDEEMRRPPEIIVNVPPQAPPVVNVSPVVNIPEQPAPVVNVAAPEIQPQVNVVNQIELPNRQLDVERDRSGRITGARIRDE